MHLYGALVQIVDCKANCIPEALASTLIGDGLCNNGLPEAQGGSPASFGGDIIDLNCPKFDEEFEVSVHFC